MARFRSDAVRNARGDAYETAIGTAPILRIYSGSVPANEGASLGAAVLLAEGTLPSDWLTAGSAGVKSRNGSWTLTGQTGAGSGTDAEFYRIYASDGTTPHEQGSVSATGGGGDMTLNNNSIADGQTVTVNTFTLTEPN
jgi:hypothetical protein